MVISKVISDIEKLQLIRFYTVFKNYKFYSRLPNFILEHYSRVLWFYLMMANGIARNMYGCTVVTSIINVIFS